MNCSRGGGFRRSAGLDLRFNVELHLAGAVGVGELKNLGQSRHLGAGRRSLARELRLGERTAVQASDLFEGQVLDVLAHIGELRIIRRDRRGIQALLVADLAVVRDDFAAVLGDLEVKFQGGHAGLEALGERRQGGFDGQAESAAVGL